MNEMFQTKWKFNVNHQRPLSLSVSRHATGERPIGHRRGQRGLGYEYFRYLGREMDNCVFLSLIVIIEASRGAAA